VRSGRRYAFVFVCQQGLLEAGALLLAASLKRSLCVELELIAGVPGPPDVWGTPGDLTLELLAELDVRVVSISNEFGPERPTANKIDCMRTSTDADKLVFLDSDILCLGQFEEECFDAPINVVPAYGMSFDQWDAAYRAAGVPMPSTRQPTLMSQEIGPPYFNSGFVAANRDLSFGDAWLASMRAIVEDDNVAPSRFEDQASLAIAIESLDVPYERLDERFNWPQFHKPLDGRRLPFFCHYSERAMLRHDPVLAETVGSLLREWPALLTVMERDECWAPLARDHAGPRSRSKVPFANKGMDLLITGMECSGVEPLSEMIGGCDNCVVRRPTPRVLAALAFPLPWPLAIFYRLERIRLLEARLPEVDRLTDSRAFEAIGDAEVRLGLDDGFVLATASTDPYLARLETFETVLPDARVVVCVRNPYDTLAAWKRRDAARPIDELARSWQEFAQVILSRRDRVMLVNYADLEREPDAVLEHVLSGSRRGNRWQPVTPVRSADRSNLVEADMDTIRAICSQAAGELGLGSS
jgi:sulfotransferase family protein